LCSVCADSWEAWIRCGSIDTTPSSAGSSRPATYAHLYTHKRARALALLTTCQGPVTCLRPCARGTQGRRWHSTN
jgi:hypothetical protein